MIEPTQQPQLTAPAGVAIPVIPIHTGQLRYSSLSIYIYIYIYICTHACGHTHTHTHRSSVHHGISLVIFLDTYIFLATVREAAKCLILTYKSHQLSSWQWLTIHAFLTKKVDSVSLVHCVWAFCLLFQDCVFQEKPGTLSLVLKNKQYTGAITSMLSLCETQTIQMT